MKRNFAFNQSKKQLLIGFLVFLCNANANVYGVERGPIWMASNGPSTFEYVATTQLACEIIIATKTIGLFLQERHHNIAVLQKF